ncbi:MAG: cupin domain-containing protein [Caldilinea sp. CFX5]|nr:cupin domain-containing protein [Caldilinea sp. CFX5]
MMTATTGVVKAGLVQQPGAGQSITIADLRITVKASGAETAGAWALLEYHVPPRFVGAPLHWHASYCESFYILAGTVTVQVEEAVFHAPPGSFVLAPPGLVHRFSNEEAVPAMFLSFVAPSGLECFLAELATLQQGEATWPPADLRQITALCERYGIYPPPVVKDNY